MAPERKQKGDGVGETESVWDLNIHSFHKQWNEYYVPNAKCVAAKPAPATPAANYCLAGALRTVAHEWTDGRTEGRTSRRLLRTGQTTPLRSPDLEASVRRCESRPAPSSRRSGSAPRPRPLLGGRWDARPPRSARFSSAQPGRVVSGLPEAPGALRETRLGIRSRSAPAPSDARAK